MFRRWNSALKKLIYNDGGIDYDVGGPGSSVTHPVSTKTADYSVTNSDYSIVADGTSNTVTITLPASPTTGQVFNISNEETSVFAVTADFNGKTFYGNSTLLLRPKDNITIQFTGTKWVWG